ncbi:MAG: hypothetical protein IPK03_01805, partial [Bacteroidetes bacterium]|nr:hypothetical protein [Bacteroidota bacterium]
MLSIRPKIGILNLHRAVSIYQKGDRIAPIGASPRNTYMIGNTIMWIDAGIDTGNIITTECTPLTGEEDLSQIHIKVMDRAHELYLKALRYLAAGKHQ